MSEYFVSRFKTVTPENHDIYHAFSLRCVGESHKFQEFQGNFCKLTLNSSTEPIIILKI